MFFVLQAEDGIRDLVRSRGLGDVYKRQGINSLSVDVDAPGSAWLLVGVNEAPGWSATIDGETVPILRANHSHMAVPIDGPGTVCLLYTSDAAAERSSVDLGGRRILKKKNPDTTHERRSHNKDSYATL